MTFALGCSQGNEPADEAGARLATTNDLRLTNSLGTAATHSSNGSIDKKNAFFQSLGTNGRSCATCHVPEDGWTITPEHLRKRFDETDGTDPIFRTNDGSNSPTADVSSVAARRTAYSQLLDKGVIRVGIGIPAGADFELAAVDDPYGHASEHDLSLFRRPLPSTNLRFLSGVMWDGRETAPGQSMEANLASQANNATVGHAQGEPLSPVQRKAIVDFELALSTAQVVDAVAGDLTASGAAGGPRTLRTQTFYLGINDLLGDAKTVAPFNPIVFDIYDAWSSDASPARAAVARGQAIFNSRKFEITGVAGVNDEPSLGSPAVINGTCTSCHDAPNAGNHSVALALDLGLGDASRRTPDMPLYTLRNKTTGETKQTTDPGRALVTGRFSDIGKFKGAVLRSLAARAPYFHNGSAATLGEVIRFYDKRFGIALSSQEKADLEAFLRTL